MRMTEFLTFQTFITPTLLIVIYYFGAIVIPLVSYGIAKWIKSSYFNDASLHGLSNEIKKSISTKQRLVILLIALFCFLCMEIFWRVLFEFFIAYFDMHDALMQSRLSH